MRPTFIIEEFSYSKHLPRVCLMELSEESQAMVDAHSLRKDLGFTTHQVLMDALIGSEEAFVVLDPKTRRLLGLFGAAQQVYGDSIVITPWFYSTGFERDRSNWRPFIRAADVMVSEWRRLAPGRTMVGTCRNNNRNFKWLTRLGFVFEGKSKTEASFYYKKGVIPNGIRSLRASTNGSV